MKDNALRFHRTQPGYERASSSTNCAPKGGKRPVSTGGLEDKDLFLVFNPEFEGEKIYLAPGLLPLFHLLHSVVKVCDSRLFFFFRIAASLFCAGIIIKEVEQFSTQQFELVEIGGLTLFAMLIMIDVDQDGTSLTSLID